MNSFLDAARSVLDTIERTQGEEIRRAGILVGESLLAGGVWHLFGTGHSHLISEEVYYRAGGLAPVNAMLFPALMQHEGPATSTKLERLPGLARLLFEKEDIRPGEVLTIISNSGKNAVPVELALMARERGIATIALTSLAQSAAATTGTGQTKKLFEVCDVVIDNCGCTGDAAIPVGNTGVATGPTSTLANVVIVQQIVLEICQVFLAAGQEPPLFKSANLPGGDAWNAALIKKYGARVNLR
ncbi:MAG: SIS domain-containing protein [Candidatus Hydrogenedentes bacterium]|nr:SIS domain-containing protein [Candidatus Hydrogenedentota bacterium]